MRQNVPVGGIAFHHRSVSGTSLAGRLYGTSLLISCRTSVIKLNNLRLRCRQLPHALRLPLSSQIDRPKLDEVWIRIAVLKSIANIIAIADESLGG
jgi:hypothetical protein